jgi:serine phosphatase RsbU (regulator of sigma subunit)
VYALIGFERSNRFRWILKEGTYLIGRRDDCSFRLSDASVSRTHASIDVTQSGDATVTDLGSLNGTFVNGRRVNCPTVLPIGSLLGLGRAKLLFVEDSVSDTLSHTLLDLQRDIDLAARIEKKLIERSPACPAGYLLSAYLDQCSMVGGDMYDVAELANDGTAIMIGDAVGHGIGATVLMTFVLASYRTQRYQGKFEPGNAVSVISRLLCQYTESSQFITTFISILEAGSGQLRYVNAGHNPPVIARADGSTSRLNATGPPVGIMESLQWKEEVVRLHRGDLLFLFTDGLIETCWRGEFFGEDRLVRLLSSARDITPEQTVRLVLEEVQKFAGDGPREDDTAIIAVKRL